MDRPEKVNTGRSKLWNLEKAGAFMKEMSWGGGRDKVRIIGRMIGGLRGWWRYIDKAMNYDFFCRYVSSMTNPPLQFSVKKYPVVHFLRGNLVQF